MKQYRVIGGRAAYRAAIEDAYEGRGRRMHNPCVLYDFHGFKGIREPGFMVTSALNGRNEDEILIHVANYDANTGNWTAPNYTAVRAIICKHARQME